jgi:hypothetical protein
MISLVLKETSDPAKARAAGNPDLAQHLKFVDHGGNGYTTVRASAREFETEFVSIPMPLERSETNDGGPAGLSRGAARGALAPGRASPTPQGDPRR